MNAELKLYRDSRRKKSAALFAFVFPAVLFSVGNSAEIPPDLQPSIETSVDRNEITIGDDILYTVTITYDPSVSIEASSPGMELGKFEIKDIRIGEPERHGGRLIREDQYVLSTYFTGDYTIPPLKVRFRAPSGEVGEVETDAIDIHVRSLTPEESENLTIRDIKDPVLVEGHSRWPVILAVAAAVLLIAAVIMWFVFLRRRTEVAVSLEPPLPPDERALIALNALRNDETLLAERRYKEFSTRLSEILRVYIHGRWGILAMDRTSHEISKELTDIGIPKSIREDLSHVFTACDLMKFAKQEIEDAHNLIDESVAIVQKSREASSVEQPPEQPSTPAPSAEVEVKRGVEQ